MGVCSAAFAINPKSLALVLKRLDSELSRCSDSDLADLLAAGYIPQHIYHAAISTRKASRLTAWANGRMANSDLRKAFEPIFIDELDMRKTPVGDYASIVTDYAFKGFVAGVLSDSHG